MPPVPSSLDGLWIVWRNDIHDSNRRMALDYLFSIICWCLWKKRNSRVFKFEATLSIMIFQHSWFLIQDWMSSYEGRDMEVLRPLGNINTQEAHVDSCYDSALNKMLGLPSGVEETSGAIGMALVSSNLIQDASSL